jgi:hypothetical protein
MRRRSALLLTGGLALAAGTVLVLRLAGVIVPWWVALPAGAALGVLAVVAAHLPHSDPGELEPPASSPSTATSALGDYGALHFAVQGAAGDRDRFEQRIRPRLSALAVELLWQRRGLDWRRDADQLPAREVVGPRTWALLTAPEHTLRLSPRSLDALLDELEAL